MSPGAAIGTVDTAGTFAESCGVVIMTASADTTGIRENISTTGAVTSVDSPTLSNEYVYGSYVDEPLALINSGGTYFYADNRVYSPAAMTDSSGVVQERYRYDSYGNRTVMLADDSAPKTSGFVWNQRGFTGYFADAESGLCYARTRMYSPVLGRFVSRDVAGYLNGTSFYDGYFVPNEMDPDGAEETRYRFISLSDRFVEDTLHLFRHYSVEEYECKCVNDEMDKVQLSVVYDIEDDIKTDRHSSLQQGVQLLRTSGYEVTYWNLQPVNTRPHGGGQTQWVQRTTGVNVSVINYDSTADLNLVLTFIGTPVETDQKFNEVISNARNYAYAEQPGFNGHFMHWPNSEYLYGNDVNNSNTFGRTMITESGMTYVELPGWHPGNDTPQPRHDIPYNGAIPVPE